MLRTGASMTPANSFDREAVPDDSFDDIPCDEDELSNIIQSHGSREGVDEAKQLDHDIIHRHTLSASRIIKTLELRTHQLWPVEEVKETYGVQSLQRSIGKPVGAAEEEVCSNSTTTHA